MLWMYDHYEYFYSYSAGIDFRRQILSIPALYGLTFEVRPAFLIASKLILEQTISICDNGDIFKRIFNSTQLRNCVELNMINNRKLTFSNSF